MGGGFDGLESREPANHVDAIDSHVQERAAAGERFLQVPGIPEGSDTVNAVWMISKRPSPPEIHKFLVRQGGKLEIFPAGGHQLHDLSGKRL